jgi:biopolymer transport protein ExbD
MAEIEVKSGGHKKGPGVQKAKKLSTRVDLTPMVDLGFLLITFFMFTTTLAQPTALKLNMPKDAKDQKEETKIKESGALTIMLGKDDQVYYYFGQDAMNMKNASFKEIRKVIIEKKKNTKEEDFVVVIKANDEATYKNAVDILDEMKINEVTKYALVNISEDENKLIKLTEASAGIK